MTRREQESEPSDPFEIRGFGYRLRSLAVDDEPPEPPAPVAPEISPPPWSVLKNEIRKVRLPRPGGLIPDRTRAELRERWSNWKHELWTGERRKSRLNPIFGSFKKMIDFDGANLRPFRQNKRIHGFNLDKELKKR